MSSVLPTYSVQVFMAGNIDDAKRQIRQSCYREGLCVTVTPTTFIYTAGEEEGVVIGFQNYPRFPSEPRKILQRAKELAVEVMKATCQRTSLIVAPDSTEWIVIEPTAHKE